jgi:chorismate synthase
MAGNSFGESFRFTTWGESHGPAIGCVIDGVPPRLALEEADIQHYLDRRRPGQSRHTSQRREPDAVRIVSGVFEGQTTGTPLALVIENVDQRSRDYGDIAEQFRPAHADFTYWRKYGIRDYRGGGRASARETAMRVAAGAVARKVLGDGIRIRGALVEMGGEAINRDRWDWDEIGRNPFWCPDAATAGAWEGMLDTLRKDGNSTGAVIEVVAEGVPAGLGEPVYDKGVEIGEGFAAAAQSGVDSADEMRAGRGPEAPEFLSNNAGGVLGGISSGQDVVVRFAVKPTSSILTPRKSIDVHGNEIEVVTKGRHDPCVGIRAVPVGEAMMACVLADHLLRNRAQTGQNL